METTLTAKEPVETQVIKEQLASDVIFVYTQWQVYRHGDRRNHNVRTRCPEKVFLLSLLFTPMVIKRKFADQIVRTYYDRGQR